MTNKMLKYFIVFLVIYEFNTYIANDSLMPATVSIMHALHSPIYHVELLMPLYILGGAFATLLIIFLIEYVKPRSLLLAGNILFLVFTVMVILASNINMFLVARFFEGWGLSFIVIGYIVLHKELNDIQMVKLVSLMAIVSLLAPIIGPIIGVILIKYYSWRSILLMNITIGVVTLYGLYRYTPHKKHVIPQQFQLQDLLQAIINILHNKKFIVGCVSIIFGSSPLLLWINISPILMLHTLHLPLTIYLLYQVIALSGLIFSGILLQFIADKIVFYKLIAYATWLIIIGFIISFIGHNYWQIVVAGTFIYVLGNTICFSIINRLIVTISGLSTNIAATLLSLLTTTGWGIWLIVANHLLAITNYSIYSYTLTVMIIGAIIFVINRIFIYILKQSTVNL
jgi:DHA1 family multidrug/chloramphenicol efflux transport protein-like MFS transporter